MTHLNLVISRKGAKHTTPDNHALSFALLAPDSYRDLRATKPCHSGFDFHDRAIVIIFIITKSIRLQFGLNRQ